jgi:hypothetical protein
VQPITVPPIDADMVCETLEALNMSRHVFAFKLGVKTRRYERGFAAGFPSPVNGRREVCYGSK